jgi:hypothetical protein
MQFTGFLTNNINGIGNDKVMQVSARENMYVYYSVTILAWIAVALMIFSISMGDKILQQIVPIYPDFSLPVFFVPWFLLVISSVQKLQKQTVKLSLQLWVLKTTVPIFIFILPFFNSLLNGTEVAFDKVDLLINSNEMSFEPYCLYFAVILLFAVHFLPAFWIKK